MMKNKPIFKRTSCLAVLVVVVMLSTFARAYEKEVPTGNELSSDKPNLVGPRLDASEVPETKMFEPEAAESKRDELAEVRDGSTRSPAGAAWLSAGSTIVLGAIGSGMLAAHSDGAFIVGAVILSTGLVFGPSVGEFYSQRWGKGTLFALGRAAAEGMIMGGVFSGLCFDNCDNDNSSGGRIALIAIGGAALLGLTVWGIFDSYKSAKQYNEEHAKKYKKYISISPFVIPSSGRNGENVTAVGLAVAGRF
jgi:hypothetical protein